MSNPPSQQRVIILGLHRSGTSLVANLVEEMGFWFAAKKQALPTRRDNPKGFWERADVVRLNDEILADMDLDWHSYISSIPTQTIHQLRDKYSDRINKILTELDSHGSWLLKDPRMCITWPVWEAHIENPSIIVIIRNPISVASSLHARNAMPMSVGLTLWANHMKALSNSIRGLPVFTINHQYLISDPCASADEIYDWLHTGNPNIRKLSSTDIDRIFDPSLVNQPFDKALVDSIPPHIRELWLLAEQSDFSTISRIDDPEPTPLDKELREAWEVLFQRETELRDLKFELDNKSKIIDERDLELGQVNRELGQANQEISELYRLKAQWKAHMQSIAQSFAEYKLSRGYRLAKLPQSIRQLTGKPPVNGAIEKIQSELEAAGWVQISDTQPNLALRLFSIIRNDPRKALTALSASRIKTLFKMLTDPQARSNLDQALVRYEGVIQSEKLYLVNPTPELANSIDLQPSGSPEVSIIIPVYNNYEMTLSCIKSISDNTPPELRYEVILADDCSTDMTSNIAKSIQGIRVARTESNRGFLENCNNAALKSRGDYLLFLNNDTNVQPHWLDELLAVVENDPGVGIVGPAFIYPDGRLQEAGGIIFKDGSGWNYGRLNSPDRPEYSFQRTVDYISGACLLVKNEIWKKSGGFDRRYTPAYYEDTDLCFTARQLGYSVVYTPFSRVVHFEGVSHGTDESSGIKKYQKKNQMKFREKWKEVLENEHYESADDLFAARHHGKSAATVLVIDHYVPMHDKDAGSRSTRKYLDLFVEEGLRVIFMGDNFYPHQPYTSELQRQGIEVLHGDFYQKNWSSWLRQNARWIDAIYIHRPHVAGNYIDTINGLKHRPRVVYFGHDLHFLRLEREAEISGKPELLKKADQWKEKELEVMRKMDLSLYPGQYEADAIKKIAPDINVSSIPLIWFSDEEISAHSVPVPEPSLLFVGGFGHPPNLDGLNWFLDKVWPKLLDKNSEIQLTIIGSKCPDSLKHKNEANLRVLGEVDDEMLDLEYKRARLLIVPLRFGAGIKGKVLEAMSKGVPVCTTPIGSEGLPEEPEKYLQIAHNEEEFCEQIIQLFNDDTWLKKSESSVKIIRRYFSRRTARVLIRNILDSKPENAK